MIEAVICNNCGYVGHSEEFDSKDELGFITAIECPKCHGKDVEDCNDGEIPT